MAKQTRYPPIGAVKARRDDHGVLVCGACGGEIVQVKDNGDKACWTCGKQAL